MTGGGFGGCTVTLVSKKNVNDLITNIQVNVVVHIKCFQKSKSRFYKKVSSELFMPIFKATFK